LLQSGCAILYYTYNAQLFLQPQATLHSEASISHINNVPSHDCTPHREYKSGNHGCHGNQGARVHTSHATQPSNNDYTIETEVWLTHTKSIIKDRYKVSWRWILQV